MSSKQSLSIQAVLFLSAAHPAAAQWRSPLCAESIECAQEELQLLKEQSDELSRTRLLSDTRTSDPELEAKLAFNQQVQASLREWSSANAALEKAKDSIASIDARIKVLETIKADVADASAYEALLATETKAREDLRVSLTKLTDDRSKKWQEYALRRKIAGSMKLRVTPDVREASSHRVKPNHERSDGQSTTCSLATSEDRARLNPNYCTAAGQNLARQMSLSPALSAADLTIPGRPLERRGLSTSITGTKDGTALSLGIADEFRIRSFRAAEESLIQRVSTLGLSATVKTDGGNLFSFSPEKEGETLGALDRLNAKSSLSAGLSLNFYPREGSGSFKARGAKLYEDARNACLDEQSKAAVLSSCQGEQLIAWILAQDAKTGGYAHPNEAAAFNNLYFGSPEPNARFGGGLSIEYARPGFAFLDPKSIDAAAIPALLAKKIEPTRYDTWVIGGYLYWRLPERVSWFDTTIVPSLSYKDTREKPDEAIFCPAIDTSAPFNTSGCKTLGIAAPKHIKTWVPGAEVRILFRGFRLIRFLAPEVALAPKLTLDTDADRWGLSVPLYFAVGSDKTLTAGLNFSREWGGLKSDKTTPKDTESGLSIVVGKTFSVVPK